MSLYFLVAIVLGAISGVAEVPAARPVLRIVSRAESRPTHAARRAILSAAHATRGQVAPQFASLLLARAESPLTGAASPRAPSE